MDAVVIQSSQKMIRAMAVVLLVIGSAGTTVVVGPALGSGSTGPAMHLYNVTFVNLNDTVPGSSGSGQYLSTVPVVVKIMGTNITLVNVTVSWQDNALSPFTNPTVTVTVTGPNGTGSAMGRALPGGSTFAVPVPNVPPGNTTVDAANEADAVAKAGGNSTNASLGSGDWTVSLDIGASAFGRIRPQGSITYSIEVAFTYFEGRAQKVS